MDISRTNILDAGKFFDLLNFEKQRRIKLTNLVNLIYIELRLITIRGIVYQITVGLEMVFVLDVFPLVVANHISVQAAAEFSGYSPQYLYRFLRCGIFVGLKIGQV